MKKRFVWYVTIICTLWLIGCSTLNVYTYPEAQQMSGGTLRTHRVRWAEAGPKPVWELQNEIEFSEDNLRIVVTAKSCRNFPITFGPLYFAIIPTFWADWFFGPFGENLVLAVNFDRAEGYEFDPSQFVIVQQGKELKPTSVNAIHRNKCYNLEGVSESDQQFISSGREIYILEYNTLNWDFVLQLRDIRNQSGTVVMPDIHFSRRSSWVYGFMP